MVLLGFTGFSGVLLGLTGFYWVLPGFYWIVLHRSGRRHQSVVRTSREEGGRGGAGGHRKYVAVTFQGEGVPKVGLQLPSFPNESVATPPSIRRPSLVKSRKIRIEFKKKLGTTRASFPRMLSLSSCRPKTKIINETSFIHSSGMSPVPRSVPQLFHSSDRKWRHGPTQQKRKEIPPTARQWIRNLPNDGDLGLVRLGWVRFGRKG